MDLPNIAMIFIILGALVINITSLIIPQMDDVNEFSGKNRELVEGDMMLTKEQKDAIYNRGINTRNGLVDHTKYWPNGEVVYEIVRGQFNNDGIKVIKDAMAEISSKSCVTFRPRKNNKEDAIYILSYYDGCWAQVGYLKGKKQGVNLARGCVYSYIVAHELMHALGFYHMQSTHDRDEYVTIMWDNIEEKQKHNFIKYGRDVVSNFNVTYDYGSLMHYRKNDFSKNGNDTIVAKQKGVKVGPGKGLTASDVSKLKRMYNCKE